MPYMLVRHKVKEFSQWKRVFDSHSARHVSAGFGPTRIMVHEDDANEVFFLIHLESIERAKKFLAEPGHEEAGEEAGVIDAAPDVWFLKDAPG